MKFMKWSIALVAAALLAPISASALGVSIVAVTGGTGSIGSGFLLEDGQTITFDLLLENATNQDIAALGISIDGYDEGVLGAANDNHLQFVTGYNGTAFGTAYFGPGASTGSLSSSPVIENGSAFPSYTELRVQAYNAISVTPGSTGDGSFDSGVDGLQTNGSDVHMRITFQANALGAGGLNPGAVVNLNIGTGSFGNVAVDFGSNILSFNNASTTITVVPEPGTALLMGLGLVGLASRRR